MIELAAKIPFWQIALVLLVIMGGGYLVILGLASLYGYLLGVHPIAAWILSAIISLSIILGLAAGLYFVQ